MEWPRQLLDKVEEFEGFSEKPYICPAGYWTIGFGTLCDKSHAPVTREEAEALLIEELDRCYNEALIQCSVKSLLIALRLLRYGCTILALELLPLPLSKRR